MQKEISRETAERLARRHRRRTWKKIVSVLACAVVFCTTYALILPGNYDGENAAMRKNRTCTQ